MHRRVINPFLLLPLTLSMNTFDVLSSETKNLIDNVLEEKSNITFVDYQEIEKLVLNNQELKSLQNLVASSNFVPIPASSFALAFFKLVVDKSSVNFLFCIS